MKKIKKAVMLSIISILMVAVFTFNVFAATIVCNVYSHVDSAGLLDSKGNNTIELTMYMRPTLVTSTIGKNGYRVSNMNCYFTLNSRYQLLPEYYQKMGVLYTISVVYQLSSGSQLTKEFKAWSYLGDIVDGEKFENIYNSPTVSIDITDPGFDYQYIYYYNLTLEFRYDCPSQGYPSGEIWDYGIMRLGFSEILSDNT